MFLIRVASCAAQRVLRFARRDPCAFTVVGGLAPSYLAPGRTSPCICRSYTSVWLRKLPFSAVRDFLNSGAVVGRAFPSVCCGSGVARGWGRVSGPCGGLYRCAWEPPRQRLPGPPVEAAEGLETCSCPCVAPDIQQTDKKVVPRRTDRGHQGVSQGRVPSPTARRGREGSRLPPLTVRIAFRFA